MRNVLAQQFRLAGITTGFLGALALLALTSRPSAAEKADPGYCGQGMGSVCKLVETCEPKGFEPNGTCRWIYTAKRSYYRA